MPASFVTVRDIALDELTRFPGNARRGDVSAIRSSLRRHGQYRSLVVRDTGDGLMILAGNHTRDALDAEGHGSARCEVITCTDDEARRINLADNRLAELGDYDNDELAVLLSYLDEDYEGTGWTAEDVEALITPPAGDGDPDDVPDPPAEPVTRPGDLYRLGPHRLLCGDATNPEHLALVTAGLEVGIVYTDPPYGVDIVSGTGTIGGRNLAKAGKYFPVAGDDTTDTVRDAFQLLWCEYPASAHVWWGGNHYAATASLPDSSCWLVWDKERSGNFADAELAWTNHAGAVRLFQHMWNGMLRASERGKRHHPTQKPVALAEWAFGVIDPKAERDIVLDVFAGSGSTLIAAQQTGRTAMLIEMEPAYCDVICRRFEAFTGIKAELLEAQDANAG